MNTMSAPPQSALRRQVCLAAPALLAAGALSGALAGCSPSQRAPYSTFTLLDGQKFYSSAFTGAVAMVNFWATWCPSCVSEVQPLIELYQHYRPRGVQVLAVAVRSDRAERLSRFVQDRQIPYPVAYDRDGSIARQWGGVNATPTAFVLDRKGRIARRFVGSRLHEVSQLMDKLLAKS